MTASLRLAVRIAAALLTMVASAVAATPALATGSRGIQLGIADFAFNQGWRVDQHPRNLADITGDGRADIVGFGNDGVFTAVSRGDSTFGPLNFATNDFGFNQGWRVGTHPRFVTDVTGDGRADIVGVGNSFVMVAVSSGNGFFAATQFVNIGFVAGSTYFLADVNADRRADLYRVVSGRVDIALALGNGSFATPILSTTEFTFPNSFDTPKVVDVTGDGRAEFLATAVSVPIRIVSTSPRSDGTYPLSNGTGTFGPVQLLIGEFGSDQGWNVDRHVRATADITGDGLADLIGFGNDAVWTAVTTP